ncbi:MAG: ParB/RepB/Spo0J family partition protein [Acutalibacteraceae bacterium]
MLLNLRNEKKIVEIPIMCIRPCRSQARRIFDDNEMESLTQSIRENGILQPLTVRKINPNEYELVAGERRLRAAAKSGMRKVPCIVLKCDNRQASVFSLIENLQRTDLNPFEEADGIQRLIEEFGLTQEEAARRLGKKQSTIANKLRLLKLDDEEREWIIRSGLTERHARALLKIDNAVTRKIALSEIIARGMNVAQAERYIASAIAEKKQSNSRQKNRFIFKDVRVFVNTINKAIDTMKSSGIEAFSEKTETADYIEYTVRISKGNTTGENAGLSVNEA